MSDLAASAKENELLVFVGSSNPELGSKITDRLGINPAKELLTTHKDGEERFQALENVREKHVFVFQSICVPAAHHLMELLIMADALKRASAKEVTAVISYFGYARQDRKDRPRVPITAKLVAQLIEAAGIDRVITMDLHADQIQGFFTAKVKDDHLFSSWIFVPFFQKMGIQNLVFVSPDAGRTERARFYAKKLGAGLALIDKDRIAPGVSEVRGVIGDVDGKNVLIGDDMVDGGGTLIKGSDALRDRGAKDIYAVCTHPVLSGDAVEKIERSKIQKLWVTDSIPLSPAARASGKIEVISIDELFAEAIIRIYECRSISELFIE